MTTRDYYKPKLCVYLYLVHIRAFVLLHQTNAEECNKVKKKEKKILFLDLVAKMYQSYYVRMALGGLKHVGVI